MLREMFLRKTPERGSNYMYTYKRTKSPNSPNSSLVYSGEDINTFKSNTTMADSFSRNLRSSSGKLLSGERMTSPKAKAGNEDVRNMSSTSTTAYFKTPKSSNGGNKRSFSSSMSMSLKQEKSNSIMTNLRNFVDNSPSIKTVLVRRSILPNKKTDFKKRNINEANNKIHIRDRYPYDEYKIDRNYPKENLNNVKKLEGYICEIKSEGFNKMQQNYMDMMRLKANLEDSIENLELIKSNLGNELTTYENANIKMLHENNKYHILTGRVNSENFYFDKEIPKTSESIARMRNELQLRRIENKEINTEYISEEMHIKKLRDEIKQLNQMLVNDTKEKECIKSGILLLKKHNHVLMEKIRSEEIKSKGFLSNVSLFIDKSIHPHSQAKKQSR